MFRPAGPCATSWNGEDRDGLGDITEKILMARQSRGSFGGATSRAAKGPRAGENRDEAEKAGREGDAVGRNVHRRHLEQVLLGLRDDG